MRVLLINNYTYLKGGSEKVFLVTLELLQKAGHEVFYFGINDGNNQLKNDYKGKVVNIKDYNECKSIKEKLVSAKNFIYNDYVKKELEAYIAEIKPDIAHLHIFYGRLTSSVISALKNMHIPMVQTVHEYRLICPVYTCINSKLEICEDCSNLKVKWPCIVNKCSKNSLSASLLVTAECFIRDNFFNYQKNIDAFIMVSKFIMDKHIKYFPKIKDKCFQIYNSINYSFYKKHSVNIEEKEKYYLYVGRLSYEKGLETLINVFSSKKHLNLKIVGTGPIMDKLYNILNNNNITNVELLGYKKGDELYNIITKAYFTIVPSEWYENNPLSIIESLALGTPVIGSNIGGIPELIHNGNNGYLFNYKDQKDLNDAIIKTEKLSKEEYIDMVNYSLDLVKNRFDNSIYLNKLLEVFSNVINNYNINKFDLK